MIAKLAACGLSLSNLKLILSYLSDCQLCIKLSNIQSKFIKISSSVSESSILGQIYFNFSINDLFFFTKKISIHNFADNNWLSAWAQNVSDLVAILEPENRTT